MNKRYVFTMLLGVISIFFLSGNKPQNNPLLEYERNTIDVFSLVSEKVVNVSTLQYARVSMFSLDVTEIPAGSGSGFLWGNKGHVVTNYHVIRGADKRVVTFSDGKTYPAKVIAIEPEKDIAVLLLDKGHKRQVNGLVAANSSDIKVGQKTIAIGSPFGFDQTLTIGVVSAVGRSIKGVTGLEIRDMIQTDASINPGNSGGPLLDSQGRLIGMNTMIYSKSGTSAGVGFAVPANTITRVVNQIIKYGRTKRPGLGIVGWPDSVNRRLGVKGFIIREVMSGSGADKAKLRGTFIDQRSGHIILGDIIVEVAGSPINSFDDLYYALEESKIGTKVSVVVIRDDKKISFDVELMDIKSD